MHLLFNKECCDYSKREREQIIDKISKSIYRNILITSETSEIDINHALANYNFVELRETFKLYISTLLPLLVDEGIAIGIKVDGNTRNCVHLLKIQ